MICPKCGKDNPEGNAVCFSCGEELTQPAGAVEPAAQAVPAGTVHIPVEPAQAQPVADAAPVASAQPVATATAATAAPQATPAAAAQAQPQPTAQAAAQATPYQQAAPQAAPYQQTAPQPQPTAQAAAPQQPAQTYKKGCVGSAWDDIKNSDGWFGRVMLLGLINLVPILNFIVPGYCMRWARQLPLGRIEPMPKSIFANRTFITGLFWFVLILVFSLAGGIAGGILAFVPILGWLAAIALGLFVSVFSYLACMRAAVADRLGAGFDISALWASFKKNPGSLFFICLVPALIVGVCLFVVYMIVFGIAAIGIGGDILGLAAMGDYAYSSYEYAAAYSVLSIIGKLLPAYFLLYLISCFCTAFLYLLIFRALGHWIARYAASWTTEPAIQASMNLYPDHQ